MSNDAPKMNRRILVIDDNEYIHADFRKILCAGKSSNSQMEAAEAALFGDSAAPADPFQFEVDSAYQGNEGLALVEKAIKAGRPYAMAFVDVRMPPGWDGIETTPKIWETDPDLQVVICTAYSDYSWEEMTAKIGKSDRMLILKKPFDKVEVLQLAHALTEKWRLHQEIKFKLNHPEGSAQAHTKALEATVAKLQAEIAQLKRPA
ncbi:MAG: multi-sensor hybrid histidine kinase [Pedosphaera sp.]|nr:multi-sensor hybrid histidine kinase [Pedosphaera sp.]